MPTFPLFFLAPALASSNCLFSGKRVLPADHSDRVVGRKVFPPGEGGFFWIDACELPPGLLHPPAPGEKSATFLKG
jgi:hypothetical protein